MYINRLKNLIQKHGKTYKETAEAVGLTVSGFHKAVQNNTFRVRDLLAIADWLNVPLQLIFKDEIDSYKTISEEYMEINEPNIKYGNMNNDQIILKELKKLNSRLSDLENRMTEIEQTEI